MNIGELAKRSGVSAKMIRHYESLGLLPQPRRSDSGYRQYGEEGIRELLFIRQARELGFALKQIEQLLQLWRDPARASSDVKRLAQEQMRELGQKIEQLQRMQQSLAALVSECQGDLTPECPILRELAREEDDKIIKTCCHGGQK
ncbi:MAG: Cu(I)-responsive transcriptional regulator [Aeromonadaceae bacterium]